MPTSRVPPRSPRDEMPGMALAKAGGYLTVGDVLLLELPDLAEDDRMTVAWEFTGYPSWWDYQGVEWHPVHTFRRQLREARNPTAGHTDGTRHE